MALNLAATVARSIMEVRSSSSYRNFISLRLRFSTSSSFIPESPRFHSLREAAPGAVRLNNAVRCRFNRSGGLAYSPFISDVVRSEEEPKKKIYNLSHERYFGFGREIDEEPPNKLEGVPGVRFVGLDSDVDPENKDCGELQPQISMELIKVMEQRLLAIEHRCTYLEGLMNQPEASPAEYSRANKELCKLKSSMDLINELRIKQKDIEGLNSLLAECSEDKEMLNMATEELSYALKEEKKLQHLLLKSLLPKDDADERDCILEVRAGTGGEEASLFAMDIFKMYDRYSLKNGWRFEVVDIAESDFKGYKAASAAISGAGAYGKLKFESGVHRVQRVPVTEKSGRIHTSAVSVVVLPQADEVDVQLKNEDLRIDTYRSGGSGGQHANTTNSAVRITHIPSGITVAIQDERSQHMNKAKALKVIRAKLYEIERSRIRANESKLRLEQIGSGDRSERIRTYNFPQGRVTDHRVGVTCHSINDVLVGENLDIFIEALILQQEMDAVASFSAMGR